MSWAREDAILSNAPDLRDQPVEEVRVLGSRNSISRPVDPVILPLHQPTLQIHRELYKHIAEVIDRQSLQSLVEGCQLSLGQQEEEVQAEDDGLVG